MKIAVYPGSFDPITNGHIDIINRALSIFDEVIVLVAFNPDKKSHFDVETRVMMIKEALKEYPNVKVDSSKGLTVKYAKEHGASHLIRGLRALTDFEYEFQLASANDYIDKDIDSIFLMSKTENLYISSSMIMAMHSQGVDISHLVPESVTKRLK